MVILGLLTPNPSREDIKKAYREQAKLWHPDLYTYGSTIKKMAEKNLQDANLAYAYLNKTIPARPPKRMPKSARAKPCKVPQRRGALFSNVVDRAGQFMSKVNRHLPKINWRPILYWLNHDAHTRFRPWYRYPSENETGPAGKGRPSFETTLRKAMRDPSGIQRISPVRRPPARKERSGVIGGVGSISASHKVERP